MSLDVVDMEGVHGSSITGLAIRAQEADPTVLSLLYFGQNIPEFQPDLRL